MTTAKRLRTGLPVTLAVAAALLALAGCAGTRDYDKAVKTEEQIETEKQVEFMKYGVPAKSMYQY